MYIVELGPLVVEISEEVINFNATATFQVQNPDNVIDVVIPVHLNCRGGATCVGGNSVCLISLPADDFILVGSGADTLSLNVNTSTGPQTYSTFVSKPYLELRKMNISISIP